MIDDTVRLNWLLAHPGAEWDVGRLSHYITWFSESYRYVVEGGDWRECIDNAIAGKAVRIT